jgi:hypothetical protein
VKLATLAFLQRLLAKFNEKSSVYSYLTILAGAFVGHQYDALFARIAAAVALGAGAILFLLSDPQVRTLLTGQSPQLPIVPTVPQPFDSDKG